MELEQALSEHVNHLVHNVIGKVVNEVPELLDLVNHRSKLAKYFKESGQNSTLTTILKSLKNSLEYNIPLIQIAWIGT